MEPIRRSLATVVEPNAFRMSRPPPSQDPVLGHEPPSSSAYRNSDFQTEPPSWLAVNDLSSTTFNPHDFLQRALAQRFDITARPSQIPALDDAFDADAALAALDTVESALRRLRDSAVVEESSARDELRNALHFSAKKRQALVTNADAVTSHVSTFGEVGTAAASSLSSDLAGLNRYSSRLSELKDARDMLALLTLETSELDAVRVSRLLQRARTLLEDGSLAEILSVEDLAIAGEELNGCEKELAASIFDWMRSAADSGNVMVVRDCSLAATNLNVEDEFIREYVKHTFAFSNIPLDTVRSDRQQEVLEPFRTASWEASNSVKESIPTILDSFANPVKPLATLLQMIVEKRVIRVADSILDSLQSKLRANDDGAIDRLRPTTPTNAPPMEGVSRARRFSMERRRSFGRTELTGAWQEESRTISAEKKRYLDTTTDIFRSLAKIKNDLFDLCRVPGAEDVEAVFQTMPDPYGDFTERHISQYLDTEKSWIDDQLGVAFTEITRIEIQTPRLAPRERSEPDVYHRYRAFYGHISATFRTMTQQAIRSTWQSLCRIVTILCSMPEGAPLHDGEDDKGRIGKQSKEQSMLNIADSGQLPVANGHNETNGTSAKVSTESEEDSGKQSVVQKSCPRYMQTVLREVLDSLVMSYLANVETTLQAATHLLPACEEDAKMQELWISGASPLTAYMQAVEILSQSNEIIDEFLLTMEAADISEDIASTSPTPDLKVGRFVPSDSREILHSELTSGLADLGAEAQIGVRAALKSLKARLSAMLAIEKANEAYACKTTYPKETRKSLEPEPDSTACIELEPTPVFMSAATFVEQQLQSVMATVSGGNRDFVVSELSTITREVVLDCWCSCNGPFSVQGALQLIADGNVMKKIFQNRGSSTDNLECLQALGQLFLESPEGLWTCVESKSLASVDARTVATLLQKREDCKSPRVVKVCQSLGASI